MINYEKYSVTFDTSISSSVEQFILDESRISRQFRVPISIARIDRPNIGA